MSAIKPHFIRLSHITPFPSHHLKIEPTKNTISLNTFKSILHGNRPNPHHRICTGKEVN